MNIKSFSMVSIYALLCNFAFAGNIELTKHINTNILKNGANSWEQKEIGKEASFNVIKDINYLYYVEQNCNDDQILKNSEFYKNTWKNIFGKAEQDSLTNMIAQIYTKSDNGKNLKQSQINTLYYMHNLLKCDFSEFDKHFNTQKSQAKTVNERYIPGWGIEKLGENVGSAIVDYNKTYKLSIDNKSVFSEDENTLIEQRKKEEEEKKRLEEQRKEEEKKRLEEQRIEEEKKQKELEEQRKEEEKKRLEEEKRKKEEEEKKLYETSVSIILNSNIGDDKDASVVANLDGASDGRMISRCVVPFVHTNCDSISTSAVSLSKEFQNATTRVFFQIATLQAIENLCSELLNKFMIINSFTQRTKTALEEYIFNNSKGQNGALDISTLSYFISVLYNNGCFEISNGKVLASKQWFHGFATGKTLNFPYNEWRDFWNDFWEKVDANMSSVIGDSYSVMESLRSQGQNGSISNIAYFDTWSAFALCIFYQKHKPNYRMDGHKITNKETIATLHEDFVNTCGGYDKLEKAEGMSKIELALGDVKFLVLN